MEIENYKKLVHLSPLLPERETLTVVLACNHNDEYRNYGFSRIFKGV